MKHHFTSALRLCTIAMLLVIGIFQPASSAYAAPALTIAPITWNIIGLDSNTPASGPYLFPVGARICAAGPTTITARFNWGDSNTTHINLRTGTNPNQTLTFTAAGCQDAYFEVQVSQVASAYDKSRPYFITAENPGGIDLVSTPTPRELYIEHLISQNRNAITDIKLNGSSIPAGGTMTLMVGQTYTIDLVGGTATQGYNQFESFINFNNTIFQIVSKTVNTPDGVETDYSANNAPTIGGGTAPVNNYRGLYADACIWDNNPSSPNYRSCVGGDYKTGGSAVTTTYTIKVISGAGTTQTLNSLLYDFSGSSFHYNADYSVGARFATIVGPSNVTIAKSFNPKSISPSGTSVLTVTLTNPLPSAITGANFVDPFPASVTLLSTTTTNTCGGTLTDNAGGALGVGDVGIALGFGGVGTGTIPANGSCTISVNVTSTVNGTYSNTTNNLFINLGGTNTDTGNNANDSLRVSSAAPCTPGQSIAQWTFPAGFNVTNPVPSSGAGTASAGGGLTPTSFTAGTNSWGTNGSVTTGATLVLANDDYLEFAIDTSLYSSVSLAFNAARANSGNAPTGIAVYYSGTSGNGAGVEPNAALYNNTNVLTNTLANVGGTLNIATPPTPTTYVRIYFYNSGNTNPGADGYVDNVTFTGCKNPPPDPAITKSFGTSPIALNGTSVLTFTINNAAAGSQSLTGLAFTDTLPAGLTVTTSGPTATCNGGSLTTTAPRTITFSGGSLAAGASCNFNVSVTGAVAGSYQNVTGFLSSTETGTTSNYATTSLTVIAPPTLAKSFNASSVLTGGTSTLTITLTNPNNFTSLTGIGFTDNAGTGWPAGVLVETGGPTAACGGTYSTTAPNSLTFTGGTLAANTSCSFSVTVTGATSGTKTDTTSAVTAIVPIALTGNVATATLEVKDPVLLLGLNKQVSTDNTNWFKYIGVIPTQNVYYRFTITNDGESDLTGISVTDSIYSMAGCTPALPATLAVGTSASCVLGPISVTSAPTPNPLVNTATATSNASTVTSQARYGTRSLSIVKNSAESYFRAAGDLLHYSYTVTNNGGYPLLGPVTITDDKIGVVACQDTTLVGDNDSYLDPGEAVVCPATGTAAYTVTAGDVTSRSVTNTAHGSADGVDSPDAIKTVPMAALTIDKDTSTSIVSSNGNVTYTIVVVNTGQIDLTNFQVTDTLPFTAGQFTVTGVNASVTSGTINPNGSYNGSSNTNLLAGTDTLALGATATITVNLTLNNATPGTYDNTATAITTQTGSVDDDGLVGGDPGTPGIGVDPETDEDVVVFAASPTKSIVTTSEPSTGNVAGTERVTIGEMVHYRIASLIPEGSFTNVQLTDNIPNGLQFLDDGTATVAFVCNGGAGCMTSNTLSGAGLVVNGSSNNISPAFAIPSSAIGGGPFISGTDVTFRLGNITNTDSDVDSEYVVIEFNALVLNVNTSAFINQGIDNSPGSLGGSNGNFRINTAALSVNGLQIGSTSPNVTVSIAEPAITSITKSVSPATGPYLPGDVLTYTMSFTNVANGGSASTAFDVVLSDTFDANLALGTVNVISTQGTSGVSACAGGTSFTAGSSTVGQLVTATVSCLDPGNSVTVTVNATIPSSTSSGTTFANSSSLTYTSLPGAQGNCSTAPFTCAGVGTSGSGTGERNGSGGSGADNTVLNNYAVISNTVNTTVTFGSITITKYAVPNDPQDFTFTGTGPNGYDFGGGFSLDDDTDGTLPNTQTFNNLVPGSYSVTEGGLIFLNWSLTGLTCIDPDGGSITDLGFATATIDLDAGENINCTFTNTFSTPVVIDAVNDSGATVNGTAGGQSFVNVLVNDTLNGNPATLANVTLTQVSTTNPNVTLNPADGSVNVAPGTPASNYTVTYQICDQINPTICDTATVTVPVVVIDAVNDSGATVNGAAGGQSLANVLINDTLNGNPATLANVTLAQVSTTNVGVTLDVVTGAVNVAPVTPAGNYTVTYQICDQANPNICDTATVTVPVTAPIIDAVDDSAGGVNGLTGATNVLNVFTNDTLNGVAVNPANVTLTLQPGGDTELTLSSDGSVDVAPGTPAGVYTFDYQICENLNPTNCDIATVNVTVVAPVIDAVDDSGVVANGATGGTAVPNVLVNDTLNGAPATLATVTITQVSTTNPNVTIDPATGAVNVAPGTPAGSYTLVYRICEQLNPSNCDPATVTVTVGAAVIDAVDDDYSATPVNGTLGGSLPAVLGNDTLNGVPATLANVTLTPGAAPTPPTGSITMNADGTITVAAGTTAGVYTYPYTICEQLNPSNCDTATATVEVTTLTPGLSFNKTSTLDMTVVGLATVADAGDQITYGFVATNTGNVTLTNVTVDDSLLGGLNCTPIASLMPGTTVSFTCTNNVYTLTQTDIDNGSRANTADVSSMQTCTGAADCTDTETVTLTAAPVLNLNKTSTLDMTVVGLTTVADAGDRITYGFEATNTGNVTLTNVTVSDNLLGSLSCNTIALLAPGATTTFTCTNNVYTLTQTDINNGNVTNTADANSNEVCTGANDCTDTETTSFVLIIDPAISKAGDPLQASIGETVTFTLDVTNQGNTSANGVVITDNLPSIFDVAAVNVSGAPFGTSVNVTPPIGTGPAPYSVVVTLGGPLQPNGLVTIEIVTRVNGLGNPPITNTARVTAQGDVNLSNNADGVTIRINAPSGLSLPDTGFAPNVVTELPEQPRESIYASTDLLLEIPSLGVKIPIVGVPATKGGWDVSWLGRQAGWLEGSAFPSWNGNSVLTSHVYDANGLPGPFINLSKLKYGDKIIVHVYGQKYTFEVRTNQVVTPNDTSAFKHEEKSWLTLITCKEYDQKTNTYRKRVVVRAVLVKVEGK